METDGSDTNRAGSNGVDNVVPFPRDWIGPPDDLVPFGSAAERRADDEELGRAVAADTFWSESSAGLHQVIEAPAASFVEPRLRGPRWAPTGRLRMAAACVAATGVMAGAAGVVEIGSRPAAGHAAPLAASGQLKDAGASSASGSSASLRLSRMLVARAIQRTSRRPAGSGHLAEHTTTVVHRTSQVSSQSSASQVTVSYVPPQSTASVPSQQTVASGGSTQSSAAVASTQSSGASGPIGAGAPFGPGQMTGG